MLNILNMLEERFIKGRNSYGQGEIGESSAKDLVATATFADSLMDLNPCEDSTWQIAESAKAKEKAKFSARKREKRVGARMVVIPIKEADSKETTKQVFFSYLIFDDRSYHVIVRK